MTPHTPECRKQPNVLYIAYVIADTRTILLGVSPIVLITLRGTLGRRGAAFDPRLDPPKAATANALFRK